MTIKTVTVSVLMAGWLLARGGHGVGHGHGRNSFGTFYGGGRKGRHQGKHGSKSHVRNTTTVTVEV